MSDTLRPIEPAKPFRWGFLSAAAVVLTCMVLGHFVGTLIEGLWRHEGPMGGRETLLVVVLVGFGVSAAVFVVLQRAAIAKFFRTMQTGVALVSLVLIAVAVGVLVPQIENFEDRTERVPTISDVPREVFLDYLPLSPEDDPMLAPEERARVMAESDAKLAGLTPDQKARVRAYKKHYLTFRWAEGYFLYHLFHPYGLGMPHAEPMSSALEGLDRFERKYGSEERQNREKQMRAAFNGRAISQEIGTFIRRHETKFLSAFDVASRMDLNRTYKSHWFATLLGLLGIGVAFNTFRGKAESWLSMRKVGFVAVHLGVITMLIGGAISNWNTVRGIAHLDLRDPPSDKFLAYFDREKPRWMPFAIHLERFARRDWKTLQVGFLDEQFKSNPPEYTLWPGRVVDLDFTADGKGLTRPRIRLEVLSVHERARVGGEGFEEAGPDERGMTLGPQATVRVDREMPSDGTSASAAPSKRWRLGPMLAKNRLLYAPGVPFRLMTAYVEEPEAARELLTKLDTTRVGWLSVRVASSEEAEPRHIPVRMGDVVSAPGGYTIRVDRLVPAFELDHDTLQEVVDPRPIDQVFPSNPAAMIVITPPNGGAPETRPVLERLDYEDAEIKKELRHKDLIVNFTWDHWSSPGPERAVLAWTPKGEARLLTADGGSRPVRAGDVLPVGPVGTKAVLEDLYVNARPKRAIELDPAAPLIEGPHFDASFYSTEPTGVEIRVTHDPGTKEETSEVVLLASTEQNFANQWLSPDRRFFLTYFHNDRAFPFEWRSVLSVWERGPDGKLERVDSIPEHDREIRVNDYFHYRGYRFFQTNADPRFPTYSGIGVVYDPGIPVVLWGMYLTILGSVLAFVIRPIAEAYGKRKQGTVRA